MFDFKETNNLILKLIISVFLCPYANEKGGPNLSLMQDWSQQWGGGPECVHTRSRPILLETEVRTSHLIYICTQINKSI